MSPAKQKGVDFQLFAPYNESVALIGSWNDWEQLPMQKDEKGYWRVNVPLKDGVYEYKFVVKSLSWFAAGEEKVVADPTAIQLSVKRDNAVLRVKNGECVPVEYEWKHDDVPLPPDADLIIYELHVGDFTGGPGDETGKRKRGTFKGVIDKLDYLAELGINAIELMPVTEFPFAHSWGYSQTSLFAVENTYGTPEDLCRLIDEAHARGIRVIHDSVYNHMEADSPLTQIDYEYWFYRDNPDPDFLDFGPKFNYEKFDENLQTFPARKHVVEAIKSWIHIFHTDGVRFDCTRALKYYDLMRWFQVEMKQTAGPKPFLTIAEHVPQDPTIAGVNGPMDAAWYENWRAQMAATTLGVEYEWRQPFNTDEVLRVLDARLDGWASNRNVINCLDNHDHDRIMWLLGAHANTFDAAAFRRMKLGAALLLTSPGLPMIWMGTEFGEVSPKEIDKQPLDWILLENASNRGLFEHYKSLIAFRKANPALRTDNFEPIGNWRDRGIIAYKRWNDEGNVVIVVANLCDRYAGYFEVGGGLEDGFWHEHVWNYDTVVQGGVLRDTLAESEVKIYVKR